MNQTTPLFDSGSAVGELWRYVEQSLGSVPLFPIAGLRAFLGSTNDEARLRYATSCSERILAINDMDDGEYFRRAVLQREVHGDIAYQLQRDHSAHTLYNYLLGLYVYAENQKVRDAIDAAFKARGIPWQFLQVWQFASLLHDVGYLFEGPIPALDWAVQSENVKRAAQKYNDFFAYVLWEKSHVTTGADIEHLRQLAGVEIPCLRTESLDEVAHGLATLRPLDGLRKSVSAERTGKPPLPMPLPNDAFSLWQANYNYFGQSNMKPRVEYLRESFRRMISYGRGDTGLRLLDHGVCSGLLQLQWSTFFFQIWFAVGKGADTRLDQLMHDIEEEWSQRFPGLPGVTYEADWWWSAVVWASAAAAMHNIYQIGPKKIFGSGAPEHETTEFSYKFVGNCNPLELAEDPLAYLGILVDCLQEWDRYSLSGEPALVGQMPAQGATVGLQSDPTSGKIIVDFRGDQGRAKKVVEDLNTALDDWNSLVDVRS